MMKYSLKFIGVVGGVGVKVLRHRRNRPLMHGLKTHTKAVSYRAERNVTSQSGKRCGDGKNQLMTGKLHVSLKARGSCALQSVLRMDESCAFRWIRGYTMW